MSDEDKTTDPLLEILAKVRSIDTRLTDMDGRLTGVENRLEALETKVDERLRETRPIWEQALREILETRNELRESGLIARHALMHSKLWLWIWRPLRAR